MARGKKRDLSGIPVDLSVASSAKSDLPRDRDKDDERRGRRIEVLARAIRRVLSEPACPSPPAQETPAVPQPEEVNPVLGSEDVLKAKEAALILHISQPTLWRLTVEGKIPAYKSARAYLYKRADIEAYFESTRVHPKSDSAA